MRRQVHAVLINRKPGRASRPRGTELIRRLRKDRCEVGEHAGTVEVHHIRSLAELGKAVQPDQHPWMRIMAKRRRKTLVVCHPRVMSRGISEVHPCPDTANALGCNRNNSYERSRCGSSLGATISGGLHGRRIGVRLAGTNDRTRCEPRARITASPRHGLCGAHRARRRIRPQIGL
ncbi:hypothetical protein ACIHDR_37100 [Nocardia sp. NPDC052278]|uniref:HNH endonuclease n=1 Tax=unclassified Nocardia TaxID=2637762 RepID=UPI0036B45EDD